MECLVQILSCGFNATGNSVLVSFEKRIRQESKIINRIFVNVGDSCQRVCQENRIKLHSVSTVLITSLAPHNISGFAGMFLAMSDIGVGELHVYGPSGLKSYLNALLPFINRKYPELKIEEIEEERMVHVKGGVLQLQPVFNAGEPRRIIATAASFILRDSSTFSFDNNEDSFNPLLRFIPAAHYFQTYPSIEELLHIYSFSDSNDTSSQTKGETNLSSTQLNRVHDTFSFAGYRVRQPIVIFVPIAVASHFGIDNVNDFEDETTIQQNGHDTPNVTTRPFSTDRKVMMQNIKEINSCEDFLSPPKRALTDLEKLASQHCALAIVLPNVLNGVEEVELRCPQTNLSLHYLSSSEVSECQSKRISKKRLLPSETEDTNKEEIFLGAKPLPAVRKHLSTLLKFQNDEIISAKKESVEEKIEDNSSDYESKMEDDAALVDVDRDNIDPTTILRIAKPLTTIHISMNMKTETDVLPSSIFDVTRTSIVKRILHDILLKYKGKPLHSEEDREPTFSPSPQSLSLNNLRESTDHNRKESIIPSMNIIENSNDSVKRDGVTNSSSYINSFSICSSANISAVDTSEIDSQPVVSPTKRSYQIMSNECSQKSTSKAMGILSSLNRNAAALLRNRLFRDKKSKCEFVHSQTNEECLGLTNISSSVVAQSHNLILDTSSIISQVSTGETESTQVTSPSTLTALTDLSLRVTSPTKQEPELTTVPSAVIFNRPLPPVPLPKENSNNTKSASSSDNSNCVDTNGSIAKSSESGASYLCHNFVAEKHAEKPPPPSEPYPFSTKNDNPTTTNATTSDKPVVNKLRCRPQLTLDLEPRKECHILSAENQDAHRTSFKNLEVDAFKVRFLGTGCAAPSTQRANSAILVTLLAPPPPSAPSDIHSEVESIRNSKRMRYNNHVDSITTTSTTKLSFSEIPDKVPMEFDRNSCIDSHHESSEEGPSILLDCGEGAASQLFQQCGGDVTHFDRLLLSLRVIWISHHHADHAAGLSMLLHHLRRAQMRQRRSLRVRSLRTALGRLIRSFPAQQWDKYRIRDGLSSPQIEPGRVLLIASETVLRATEFCLSVAGLDDLVSFVPITNSLYAGLTGEVRDVTDGRLARLTSVSVQHCNSSFALVLEHSLGSRLVYSGDCRPSPSLIRIGRDCQLLIHESTFDDCESEEAVKKRHCTYNEALHVATQMRAARIVLTHFSQRYSRSVNEKEDTSKIAVVDNFSSPSLVHHEKETFSSDTQRKVTFGRRRARNTLCGPSVDTLVPSPIVQEATVSTVSNIELDKAQKICGIVLKTEGRLLFANDFTMFRFPSQFDALAKASVDPFG